MDIPAAPPTVTELLLARAGSRGSSGSRASCRARSRSRCSPPCWPPTGGGADLAAAGLLAAGLLAAGHDVIVYPEGTRSRDGRIGGFHRGAARLAATAGVPLVPVGISGTRTLLPPGGTAHRPRRAAVTVRIGVPLTVPTRTGGNSMIMASSGGYSAISGHDHELGSAGDATVEARARVVTLVTGLAGFRAGCCSAGLWAGPAIWNRFTRPGSIR